MSSNRKDIALSEDEQERLKELESTLHQMEAALGRAYLEYGEAKVRFEETERILQGCVSGTRGLAQKQKSFLESLAAKYSLNSGEWVYDGKGRFVRKDVADAESP